MSAGMSRRELLQMIGVGGAVTLIAACQPRMVEVEKIVKETVIVEKVVTAEAGPAKPIELLYWVVAGGVREKLYGESVDRFNEANGPALTAKMEPLVGSCETVQQKILTAIASGWVPDVVHMDTMFINQVASTGVFLHLDDMPGCDELVAAIFPGSMEPLMYEGHVLSVPVRANSLQYFYDKDMAEEAGLDPEKPPVTLDDLTEWASKMTKKNASGGIDRYGYDYRVSNTSVSWTTHAFYPLVWGFGGEMIDANGLAAFNQEPGINALKWWVNLVENKWTPDQSIANGMELKKVASTCTGEWEIFRLKKELGINLGVAKFPYPKGGTHVIPLGGRTLTMYKANPYPEAGWKLILHVMSKDEQMSVTRGMGGLTPRRDVLDDPWWQDNPEYQLTLEDMEAVRPKDATPFFLQMTDILMQAFQKACLQGVDPAVALNEAATEFNALVQ